MVALIFQIIAGIAGLWLAQKFVPGVEFSGTIKDLLMAGAVLGLLNFFVKPILKLITLPLRILTLGLFSLIINLFLVIAVDILFVELTIQGIVPLFLTTAILWLVSYFLGFYPKKKKVVTIEE